MLPSSGYFRGIACPAHARGSCGRPYCHFHHDVKERNVSSSAASSQAVTPAPAQEEADAEEGNRQGTLQDQDMRGTLQDQDMRGALKDQDMRQGLPGCSTATLSAAPVSSPEPEGQEEEEEQQQEQQPQQQEQQESEPHTSQPATAAGNIPKPDLLHQLMNEALKKVLAENPALASTVDASAIRIGIDPVGQASPDGSKTKKTFYPRPPDTPSYNPTPIKELKKRKVSVDGGSSVGYTPTGTTLAGPTEAKRNEEEEDGGVMGEFSSSDSEEVEKNADFDLLEEVLAEHSKNNKVKVKKKRVKELGKLQYSLINADKKKVDNNVLIADAKKLTDKEVKRYEVSQVENVNKVITDGPYFLPPSPVFTSSSDGFEAFNSRASYQDEEEEGQKEQKEKSKPDKCKDKPLQQTELTKANSEPASEKNTAPKQSQEPSTSSEKEQPKTSGHTHLPKLLPTLDAPKLSRPNVRNWIPLVRNPIPVPEAQKSSDQLDEMLKMMDGSDASNKRKSKESEHQTSSQKNTENARPRKKYKVDLNKEIESLTNPAVDQVKETVAPEEDSTDPQPGTSNNQDGDKKQDTKEEEEAEENQAESKEKRTAKKTSRKNSEDKKKRSESESENSDEDSHTEGSEDSKHRRGRHKKKRKRSRSSSSDSGYSRHRKKKRKRSRRRHRKRSKKYRKRRDSMSSLSDQSKDSEEQEDEEEEEEEVDDVNDDGKEEVEVDDDDDDDDEEDDDEEEKDDKEEENENKSKEDSESDNKDDSNDEVDHRKKSRRHRKKHKHYRKSKRRKNRRKAKRKRKRSKSYSRSRSSSGSRDSSRSRSRSRSSSKHRKKKSRSRHRSRNESDSEERDSDRERSRSRSSSRQSSKHRKSRSRSSSRHSSKRRKSRESREKDSGSSKLKESSKSKDGRLEEEGRKATKGGDRRSRDRSSSKSRQQGTNEESSKKHSQEETPIPLPVDPSKIKVEKNASEALIPDLSKVKVEKEEESSSEKSNTQVNTSVHTKGNDKSHEEKHKGHSESRHSKTSEKIHGRRRSSTEEKSKRRSSHDRKDSTESMSDKGIQRRQSCESKTSDAEASQQRKKPEERRLSSDKNKMTPSISSQPSGMSMFDLVLASTKKPKPKTLTEISIFDSICSTDTNDGEEASDRKVAPSDAKKSKDTSHKSSGESGNKSSASHTTDHKSGSSSRTRKSSRSDKDAHTDSHHKHDKNDNKSSHSSSKSKSSSSHHHSSSNNSSSSSHKKSSSSRGSSSKHHNASATSASTTSTTSATSSSSSSKHSETNSSSSRNKKASESGSSKTEKDSSRHSSTSNRKHSSSTSSSSSKHQNSTSSSSNRKSSSSSSKHKENKSSVTGSAKLSEGSESAKKRKVSEEEDSPGGLSDNDHFSSGGDSPMPDLSVLDEIPQDDWEQMLSGSEAFNIQEPLEESDGDDMDHDDPGVMEECMKMFNEFQQDNNPLENQVLPKKIKTQPEDSKEPASALSKQRVARSSSSGNLIIKKPAASRHQKNNPMQRMVERYQKLKEELKLKEKQLHHLQGGSSAVSSSSTSRTSIAAASSSTHHSVTSPSTSGKTKKRIAHVPNVSSLLNSQGKIRNHSSSSSKNKISPKVATASGVIPETTAHTVAKGGKRVAHVPRPGSLARPIIQPEHGSLVPQNIRQRYLNALIEECKKFCIEREAFNIAAAEERVCYQRAPSRMVYLNLVVNAVKRLRTQQQAGEGAQELLDRDPQLAEKMCVEEPSSSSSKPSTSPSPSSSPSSSRSHPVNPNHVQLSHTTVLSSGGFKGSWSIEKSKKNANSSDGALKGETFYKHLLKYVLTEEQLEENGYPCPDPEEKGKAVVKKIDTRKKISPSALERYCDRCSALYNVDKWGFPKTSAPCVHHWGRPYKKRKYGTFETTYSCCGGEQGSAGCSQATTHVSQNYNPKNLRGYVRTISKDMSSSNKEVYALDCEMCYTTEGNELTRVTVISWDGNVVYEQLVKPDNPILDYNTRFSGITESDMEDVKLTIRDVQAALLARFSDKTILIGHSLESDLHALKVIHNTVVDTSVVFPHKMGAPYKRALKNLAAEHLKRIIQDDVSGHDSAEDAIACLHLMQWKVKESLKGFSK